MAASMAVPTKTLAESDGPLLEVVQRGPLAVEPKIFAGVALFALANTILINMITASRLLYGMSREGVLPGALATVHRGRRTPVVAIVFTTLLAVGLIATGDLESLAETTVLLLLIAFIGVNVAVLAARRDPVEHDHFRVWSPVPILGIVVCIGLITQQEAGTFLRAGILLAIGLVLYAVNALVLRREGAGAGPAPSAVA
jgi:basic amino acid/polyamine antiporter, APA family